MLFVDDDKGLCEFVQRMFKKQQYDALIESDPLKVTALIEKEQPQVVILDILMPAKSGLELLKEIKQKYAASIKVIMLTGGSGEHEAESYARSLGADGFLTKPFDTAHLRSVVSAQAVELLKSGDVPNILIVDDEVEVVKMVASSLKRMLECHVDCAYGGEEALQKTAKRDYDLILLDLKMPGMTGKDVLEGLKKQKKVYRIFWLLLLIEATRSLKNWCAPV